MKTLLAFTITLLLCLALTSAALRKDCKPKHTNCKKDEPVCGRGIFRDCYWFKNRCEMDKAGCNRPVDLNEVDIGQCRGLGPNSFVSAPCQTE